MATRILSPKILLLQDDPDAARNICGALSSASGGSFDIEWVRNLSAGLERLTKNGIDAILLALSLPDSSGLETFDKLHAAAADIPILILGGNDNEAQAKEAPGRKSGWIDLGRVKVPVKPPAEWRQMYRDARARRYSTSSGS